MAVNVGLNNSWLLRTPNGRSFYSSSLVQDGLVMNLDFGKTLSYPGSGSIVTDLSGNNNNGTLINNPTFSSSNGGQFIFDGTAKYIDAPLPSGITNTGTSTIQFWANISSPSKGPIFGVGSFFNGWAIGMSDTSSFSGQFNNTGTWLKLEVNFTTIALLAQVLTSGWRQITLSKNNTTYRFYINGSFNQQFIAGAGNLPTTRSSINYYLSSGVSYYGNNPVGQALIYNRVLSDAEVTQNFNATKSRFGL